MDVQVQHYCWPRDEFMVKCHSVLSSVTMPTVLVLIDIIWHMRLYRLLGEMLCICSSYNIISPIENIDCLYKMTNKYYSAGDMQYAQKLANSWLLFCALHITNNSARILNQHPKDTFFKDDLSVVC